MKLWNRFVGSRSIYANYQVRDEAELFARRFAASIVQRGLRHTFLLHLINLWDFGLMSRYDISRCIAVIDDAVERGLCVP
mmetsp:Transcript_6046/g.20339  ORF Transcript_6046/g.20339 Transcript_6046/m.20339 type:complete len:80 (-) Transcript_6046:81-320(-)